MPQMSRVNINKLGRKLTREGSPSSMKTRSTSEANCPQGLLYRVRLLMAISEHRAHAVCHFWAQSDWGFGPDFYSHARPRLGGTVS